MALLSLLVAGCRFGFSDQAVPDAVVISPDAAASSCAASPDGTPCDDHNICTATSACSAGACVGSGDATCEVANSMHDFSEQQGGGGWYYGCWDISDDVDGVYDASDFQAMMDVSGIWRPIGWVDMPDPNFTWAYLAAWGGHPGSFPIQRADVRRWVSTVEGDAFARVTHKKADTGGGDGTRAMLFVDGQMMLTRDVAGDDGVGFSEDVPVTLHVGTTVDLLLHFIGDDAVDTTTQELDIVSR